MKLSGEYFMNFVYLPNQSDAHYLILRAKQDIDYLVAK